MNNQHLDQLTALRFFAAVMIVIGHGDGLYGSIGIASAFPYHQAVSFFFVLSGFVLAYNYPGFATKKEVFLFYVARLARIWPAHIVTACIALWLTPKVPWLPPPSPELIFLNLFLLHAWVPLRDMLLGLNVVSWALSVELFCYVCFPLVVHRWRERWHWIVGGTFLLAVFMVLISTLLQVPRGEMTEGISMMGTVYMHPLARIFEFILGVAAASVYRTLSASIVWTRPQATVIEVGALLMLVFVLRACKTNVEKQWVGEAGQYYILMQGAGFMFAGLIVVFAFGRGALSGILSSSPLLVGLGEISFALYLVHTIVLRHFELHRGVIISNLPLWYSLYWGVCLTMAYAFFIGVEEPLRRFIVALAKQKIKPELRSSLPPFASILKPMLTGAVLFSCLVAFGYWLKVYVPMGN